MKRVLLTLVLFKIHSDIFNAEHNKDDSETKSSDKEDPKKVALIDVSNFILDGLDKTRDPCSSFYSYACGNWIKNNDGKGKHKEEFTKSSSILKEQWLKEVKQIDVQNNQTKDYVKSIRVFFDQCLDVKFDKRRETIELYKAVENIVGPIPIFDKETDGTDVDVWTLNAALQKTLQSQFLFKASVEEVVKDCDRMPTLVIQPLTDFQEIRDYEDTLETRLNELAGHLNLTIIDKNDIKKEIKDISSFRKQLLRLYLKYDFENTRVKLNDLPRLIPEISWNNYFQNLFSKEFLTKYNRSNPELIIRSIDYFRGLPNVLSKSNNRTIVNFAYLQVMRKSKELLKGRLEELGSGSSEIRCFDLTVKHMLPSILRLHFDNLGISLADWKYDIELMMQSLSSAFRYLVTGLDWLDSREKTIIIKKTRQITFLSGIPEWIMDDDELAEKSPHFDPMASLYENDLWNEGKKFRKTIERLLNPKKVVDPDPRFEYGAYYREKTIDLHLGFALPPFYHLHYPLAKKYGTLGWIIAHELMHAFDSKWLLQEEVTGVKHWLNNDTLKLFADKNHCLVKQYSKFCYIDLKQCVRGRLTINDNIADVNGLKIAYLAYKFASQTLNTPEPQLPSILNTTNDRLFFLSAARIWCGSGEEVSTHISYDEHAPRHARVDVSMKNFPIFAKIYRCPIGSKLAPIEICSLWGDVVDPL